MSRDVKLSPSTSPVCTFCEEASGALQQHMRHVMETGHCAQHESRTEKASHLSEQR